MVCDRLKRRSGDGNAVHGFEVGERPAAHGLFRVPRVVGGHIAKILEGKVGGAKFDVGLVFVGIERGEQRLGVLREIVKHQQLVRKRVKRDAIFRMDLLEELDHAFSGKTHVEETGIQRIQ